MVHALTDKQRIWLDEYLKCWNATEAARRAGYQNPRESGYRNTTKDYIEAEIHKRLSASAMSADEVVERLGNQGRFDPADLWIVDGDGIRPNWVAISRGDFAGLIKSIRQTKDGWQIEAYDAQAALVHIGKHHGIFTEKIDVTSKGEKLGTDADTVAEALTILDSAREAQGGEGG